MTRGATRTRTFRLLRPGVIEHWCPGCGERHAIDIHALSRDGRVTGWDGDPYTPTIPEPVRRVTPRGVCEYVVRGGVLYFLQTCWHPLAGTSRHLEECPQ
jgi:hypothetical protein